MSPEKKEQAIEKACGWEELPEGHFHPDNPIGQTRPDYLGDLNACHEMEKVLKGGMRSKYDAELTLICSRDYNFIWESTAPQRVEAFLRALGLWEKEVNTTKSASPTSAATEESSATQPLVTKPIS